jgi:hypothetical protein
MLLLAGCADLAGSKYPITDSGYWRIPGLLSKSIYWIDNRRVLFHGKSAKPDSAEAHSQLYVWDTEKNTVTPYAYTGRIGTFCLKDGYIWYGVERDEKFYVRRGPLGGEQEAYLPPPPEDPELVLRVNEHTCREYRRADQPRSERFSFSPLRPGHGYWGFDYVSRDVGKPLLFLPEGAPRPIELPIEAREGRLIEYSAYADAYVVSRIAGLASLRDLPTKVWLLYPTGRVDTFPIPKGPWTGYDARYAPTRAGLLMTSRALTAGSGPGAAGLYLVNGDWVERILAGLIEDIDVSPDGCKVAISVNPYTSELRRSRIKMIDVCKKGG